MGSKSSDAGINALKDSQSSLLGLATPDIEQQKLYLEHPELVGKLTPDMEQSIIMEKSKMEGLSSDPRLASAQRMALESLVKTSASGLTEADLASLREARNQVSGQEKARQDAIMQNMAERGMGGSGAEIASRLISSQGAEQTQAEASDRAVQDAFKRQLEAMSQSGQLASNIRGQEWGEKSDVAKAEDVVNQYNTQNAINQQQRNVNATNQAQAMNLAEKQRIADQGTALSNQQQQYNKELLQKQFENEFAKRKVASGLAPAISQAESEKQAANAGVWNNIVQGGATIGGSLIAGPAGAAIGSQVGRMASQYTPTKKQSY